MIERSIETYFVLFQATRFSVVIKSLHFSRHFLYLSLCSLVTLTDFPCIQQHTTTLYWNLSYTLLHTQKSMLSNLTKAAVAKATKSSSSSALRSLATRADLLAGHG
jgi:hypothetical protein